MSLSPRPTCAFRARLPIVGALLLLSSAIAAQTAPDAGSVLRQIEQQRADPLPAPSRPLLVAPPPLQDLAGATVNVSAFRFEGNSLLSSARLARAVAGYVGRPATFAQLQQAAVEVANTYRKAGWVVRAYLPQQEIEGGAVLIQIIEATLGDVRVEGATRRVPATQLEAIITSAQSQGAPLNARALDRGLLLINDLPGVVVTGRLGAGNLHSESDLILAVDDGPAVNGSVTVDNAGARFTGTGRAIAAASLNGPFHIGDRADALLLHSKGSDYQRLAYSLPLGNRGIRVGANASHLTYGIVTRDFAALDAHGTSRTLGLEASYPLVRRRLTNLYVGLSGEEKRFNNRSAGETTTKYSARTGTLEIFGNAFDSLLGGGATNAGVGFVGGRIDLSGSPNEAIDALTTRTAGSFAKLQYSASRLQALTPRLSLYARVSGQRASKNLDSSEKLYLGGAAGVRAYPQDEGGGTQGLLTTLEARVRLPARFSVTGFFDSGRVRVNKFNEIPGAAANNDIKLEGAGLSADWTAPYGLHLKATLSRRIGSNPNPTSTGDDQDGTLTTNRFWLQASMTF